MRASSRLLAVATLLVLGATVVALNPAAAVAANPNAGGDHQGGTPPGPKATATPTPTPTPAPTAGPISVPAGPSVLSLTPSATTVSTGSLTYALTFSEPVTGLETTDFGVSGTSPGWAVDSVAGVDADYTITVKASSVVAGTLILTLTDNTVTDQSGTSGPSSPFTAPTVTVEPPPPPLAVSIDGGATTTSNPTLHLALATAVEPTSGATMVFSLDGGSTWTDAEPYAASKDVALATKWRWGPIQVDVQVVDRADTLAASASISYVMANRSTMALKPSYVLTSTLDYGHARLTTHMTVDIVDDDAQPIGYLNFSVLARAFGELAVSRVQVDGHGVTPSYPNSADLRVPLGFNLRRTETVRITIDFVATASGDLGNSLKARFSKANGIMQISSWYPLLSSGHGLRYPGDSQYSVASAVRLELTHPSGVTIAAPGTLISSTSTTKVYSMDATREFAFAASPSFRHVTGTASGVQITVFYLSGADGGPALTLAKAALTKYVNSYGPYSRTRFVIAQSPRSSSANEYSGIVFIGSSGLGKALVVAHETAHQWFYDQVGNDQLGSPWLDEAFAEFASRYSLGIAMPSYCSNLKVDVSVYVFPNSPATSDCNMYNQTIYNKGSKFLNGIRTRMGTAAFMKAMRAIVSENRFGIVTTAIVRSTFLRFATNPDSLNTYMSGFLH
jgi:hypothetical protein